MSTEAGVAASTVAVGRWRRLWTNDLRTVRVLRYAFGVTAAMAISFSFEWMLFFLTPVFTAVFLSLPLPRPTLRQSFTTLAYIVIALVLGLVFTLFLVPYPLAYVLLLGLVLFHIYYLANRGGSLWLVLMSLIAVIMLPMLGSAYEELAIVFALYFAWSSLLALVFFILAHLFFPDPPGGQALRGRSERQRGYSPVAAVTALKSTLVLLPLVVVFTAADWSGQILILVFAAIFSLSPELSKGKASGIKSLKSTIMGGIAALILYYLLVAVPEFHFFILLMFLTFLLYGIGIFSGGPNAQYLGSAASAVIVLLGSMMGEGVDIADKFITRVLLISATTVYVVAALSVLNHFLFQRLAIASDLR